MFKKLKDKLAEEVKSSPQRIQQFAQAAQAAVTSASSSISDITNNELFSIGDNDTSQQTKPKIPASSNTQHNAFQDVSLMQPTETVDFVSQDIINLQDNQRQRRLSNSSFASDVSFRLPSYESPSMYHLQSDMEISASEAEERGFSSGAANLDRVTKEQLYAAYKRTQDRYTKYRTQYADLARHYKLLERENAKARSVLVETQDKALRRISELKEQCSLEQSAKAHLERALRMEIEERNMKIDSLNTKIKLLQDQNEGESQKPEDSTKLEDKNENEAQLINLACDTEKPQTNDESKAEIFNLNTKIQKLEQLLNKYKDSLKTTKEKNSQMAGELQMLSTELESKHQENKELRNVTIDLNQAKQEIQELKDINEQLQNKINAYDFNKTKELSTLEVDLQKSQEEITDLRAKIEIFTKREEEYAISLAENKLSIHKELESKETEIKSLKDSLTNAQKEIQSLNIVINEHKSNLMLMETERIKLNNDISELNLSRAQLSEMETQIQALKQKCQFVENLKAKLDEEHKCLQLQMKQETAEKLAMIDRNSYLESKIIQLTDEIAKKSLHVTSLESELLVLKKESKEPEEARSQMIKEIDIWKTKYSTLESEIQEEREELVKLQTEIEKLLTNHELIQNQNSELHSVLSDVQTQNQVLQEKLSCVDNVKSICKVIAERVKDLKQDIYISSKEMKSLEDINRQNVELLKDEINTLLCNCTKENDNDILNFKNEELKKDYHNLQNEVKEIRKRFEETFAQLNMLQKENNTLLSEISEKQTKYDTLNEKLQSNERAYTVITEEMNLLKEENKKTLENLQESKKRYVSILSEKEVEFKAVENKLQDITKLYECNLKELDLLKVENKSMMLKLHETENKNQLIEKKTENLSKDYDICQKELVLLKEEKLSLLTRLEETENQCQNQLSIVGNRHTNLENENERLQKKIKDLESETLNLTTEIHTLKRENETIEQRLNIILTENTELKNKIEENQQKLLYIDSLEHNIHTLTQENAVLKNKSENITNNITKLETELNDVRLSHKELEIEKDHVNALLEKLENDEQITNKINQLQSENSTLLENVTILNTRNEEFKREIENLTQINSNLSDKIMKHEIEIEKKIYENETLISKSEYDALKEDNKRLQSDIEGLQTYLAKISKENSVLNDKLRELIVSSENYSGKQELSEINFDIQKEKEQIDNLIRENSLLVEENLELKDQLNSQNYDKSSQYNKNDQGLAVSKENYNTLLDTKIKLENRLTDLEHINKSVNGNVQELQINNEKLRLSNEKLERRLDEALVSLRHLHSLQENTELEYLRNILYEYLTGSGSHSVTLAKVIAAVVKFDEMQTQLVLQKEKERQGFLRQLGII